MLMYPLKNNGTVHGILATKKNEILLFAETWMLLHVMSITDCNTE